jgi:hypothetical protein
VEDEGIRIGIDVQHACFLGIKPVQGAGLVPD